MPAGRARSTRRKPGATPATEAGGEAPSVLRGMRGLNQLAGNQAMAAVLARRHGTAGPQAAGAELEADDRLEEAEQALASLRLSLDDFEELMKAVADESPESYARLRRWVQQVLGALHEALGTTADYDGGLADELAELMRLPEDEGSHRIAGLSELAKVLQAQGEKAHAHLSGQLPGMGARQTKPLQSGETGAAIVAELRKQVRRRREAVEGDREPGLTELATGGAGLLALGRPGRKKKRKKR
jgi:ElaB/YqjD/DUF883 family membrane-anchored ribosome-binding protein